MSAQIEHTVTIAGTWTPRLSDGINGLVHVDMRYNSEVNIPSGSPNALGRTPLYNQGYPLINAVVGLLTVGVMWLCGVANPLLWGLVAFVVNFVPILGPIVAMGLFLVPSFRTLTGPQHGYLVVTAAKTAAMLTYSWREYRAHADA